MIRHLFGLGFRPRTFEFKCADCGEVHRGSPSFGYAKPPHFFNVPEGEREQRIKLNSDLCRILSAEGTEDGETIYLIRALLEIPIKGADEPFSWGVWVTQSKESFYRYIETYSDDQSGMGSFGWLAVTMKSYQRNVPDEPLEHLECNVDWAPPGKRPTIRLWECDHPLYRDQQEGISWDRAIEIARAHMHD